MTSISLRLRRWPTWAISALAILVTLLTVSNAFNSGSALANTPGAVDSTFKTNFGSQTTNRTYDIAVLSDGSVIFTGDFNGAFKKVSATGVADATFNSNASVTWTVNSGQALAVDSLGRIVVGDNSGGPLNRFSSTSWCGRNSLGAANDYEPAKDYFAVHSGFWSSRSCT